MTLDGFLPYVLPMARGCPEPLAEHNIRLAIIELCRRSMVWREYQQSQNTVADQTAYNYIPGSDQQVMKLLSLTLAGEKITVVEPDVGKEYDQQGVSNRYAYGGLKTFELRPAQEAGLAIVTYSAVAPSIDAQDVPDELMKYAEGIGYGALARILRMQDYPFTNKEQADTYGGMWERTVGTATTDASTGSARVKRRTTSQWF